MDWCSDEPRISASERDPAWRDQPGPRGRPLVVEYRRSTLLRDIQGHPRFPLDTGQTNPSSVRLTIMTLAWSTSAAARLRRSVGLTALRRADVFAVEPGQAS